MATCDKCGSEVEASAAFCPFCGVTRNTATPLADQPPEASASDHVDVSSDEGDALSKGSEGSTNSPGDATTTSSDGTYREMVEPPKGGRSKKGLVIGALGVAAAVVVAVALSTSSSSSSSSSPTTTTTYPSLTTDTSTTTTTPPPATFNKSWTTTAESNNGYAMTAELQVGDPAPFTNSSSITNGDATAGSSCSVTATTDAVIPFELTLTNTTSGTFDDQPSIAYGGIGSLSSYDSNGNQVDTGTQLEAEPQFAEGPQCESDGQSLSVKTTNSMSPGSTSTTYGFFIIPNYYSPSHPSGDSSLLTDSILTVSPTQSISSSSGTAVSSFDVKNVSGPGVVAQGFGNGWEFDLAGTTPAQG